MKADQDVVAIDAEVKKAMEAAAAARAEQKVEADKVVAELAERKKTVVAAAAAAAERLKKATAAAQPQDIADIVVTEPIAIRVKPAEPK